MGKHDDTCESAGRELTNRRLRAVIRRRRMRRERHSWRFVNAGLAAAILVGSGLATISGQSAAAQATEAASEQKGTVVQADWQVDTVLADMAADYAVEQAAREQAAAEAAEKKAEEQAAAAEAKKKAEEAAKAAEEAERIAAEEAAAAEASAAILSASSAAFAASSAFFLASAAEAEAAKPWTAPSSARITSFYGMRNGRLHGGTDFGNWEGDEIKVVGDGTVIYVGYEAGGYGNVVYVDHGDGIETRYAHASEVPVSVGDEVSKGDTIILSGNTGGSTGPHLHFEVLLDGEKVDSLAWLEEQGVDVG
jgi:murein DD-endopeptidase MepM/ murein hydrolase activator NlpD